MKKFTKVFILLVAVAAIGSVTGYPVYTAQACEKCDDRDDVRKCGKCGGYLNSKWLGSKGYKNKYEFKCKDCGHSVIRWR